MYTTFYKLDSKPFQISSDPTYLWLGEKHKEALATLKYGVLDNKGFLLLTGDVGTGKTTLINSLIESLSEDVIFASVSDPALSKLDFFNYIALEFGIDQEFISKGSFLVGFRKFLLRAFEDDKKVLLIIDEAQLLTQELLEEIRLLSNIEKTHTKLINIFFVGQNEFNESLNLPQNRAVRQRLTLNYHIDPLTPDETDEYIKHRLKVAGSEESIFEPQAVQEIFMYSGGFPRRINIICDHALLSGYVQDKANVDVDMIKECAKDLKIPVYSQHKAIDGFGAYQQPDVLHAAQEQQRGALATPPRKVTIQPAPFEKPQTNTFRNVALGIAGVLLFIIFILWMLVPGIFSRFTNIINQKGTQMQKVSIGSQPMGVEQIKTKSVASLKDIKVKEPEAQNVILDASLENTKQFDQENLTKTFQKKTPDTEESAKPEILLSKKALIIPIDEVLPTKEEAIQVKIAPLPTDKIIVRFKYDTNEFTPKGYEQLKDFADILAHYPAAKIKITGYSDSGGYSKYNKRLSEFRANIVKSFFLGRGAKPNQFEVQGLGSSNPLESNTTAWGRTMNRRVEIEVIQ